MSLIIEEQTNGNPEDDGGSSVASTSGSLKGKIDHSSAGAQWIMNSLFRCCVTLKQQDQTLVPYGLA
ncbi:hypothetical protein, partial [Photobacterium damselae]|uniref:hypothetical protein n=1 Tax=Photobacterium damselae TaxID=38293 RepID=UPI0040684419